MVQGGRGVGHQGSEGGGEGTGAGILGEQAVG